MSEFIRTQTHGRVMEITIARPAARNALTLEMYDAMSAAFDAASEDEGVRVLLVRGAEGVFTAGNDLKDFMVSPPSGEDSPVFGFLHRLLTFAKPLVAAVDGHAVGIGTTMLFHCDLVYCSDRAKFKLPFVNLALVPEAGSSLILERMVGHQLASELLLLGETFGPELARRVGFVNATLEGDAVYAHAMERAHELARRPPEAVRLTKQLLKGIERERLEEVMKAEAAFFVERLASPELAEAISAFFEKREPQFD
jgi:enoyl-CoA hydratase/carnithine racemase